MGLFFLVASLEISNLKEVSHSCQHHGTRDRYLVNNF